MRNNFNFIKYGLALLFLLFTSCNEHKNQHEGHGDMKDSMNSHPKDSVTYYCPMHPEVISNKPGTCPKCGMDLELLPIKVQADTMASLLAPTNQTILSSLKAITPLYKNQEQSIKANGYLTYNPEYTSSISARTTGRIEKLYVRYNFQRVSKGQKLLELYSPELLTAQNEYLYLLTTNDSSDIISTASTKEKLINLGMTKSSIEQLQKTKNVNPYVPVYATSSGHVHFNSEDIDMSAHALSWPSESSSSNMNSGEKKSSSSTLLREGDYVKKGDVLFLVTDESGIWALFKILPSDISYIKKGDVVEITIQNQKHNGQVNFIEKSFDANSDFYTVRVYLACNDHSNLQIGTLIQGNISITNKNKEALWIPNNSLLNIGKGKSVVFIKNGMSYETKSIRTGVVVNDWVEVTQGLTKNDSIAPVASYLIDSEAFIETKE